MFETSQGRSVSARPGVRGGFTLPELLIVIAMMSIMLSIAGPKINRTMIQASVRSAAVEITARITIARQAAIRRGTGAAFNMDAARTKVWVNVDQKNGTPLLLGDTLFLQQKYGVTGSGTIDAIQYDARGFANLPSDQSFGVAKGSVSKSVCVTAAGFILSGCTL